MPALAAERRRLSEAPCPPPPLAAVSTSPPPVAVAASPPPVAVAASPPPVTVAASPLGVCSGNDSRCGHFNNGNPTSNVNNAPGCPDASSCTEASCLGCVDGCDCRWRESRTATVSAPPPPPPPVRATKIYCQNSNEVCDADWWFVPSFNNRVMDGSAGKEMWCQGSNAICAIMDAEKVTA